MPELARGQRVPAFRLRAVWRSAWIALAACACEGAGTAAPSVHEAPAMAPDARPPAEPLACSSYFPGDREALAGLQEAVVAFWLVGLSSCRVRGFFEGRTACDEAGFLQHLFEWSLLLFGCETSLSIPVSPKPFLAGTFAERMALSRADLSTLIEHYLAALEPFVALEDADRERIRLALTASAAGWLHDGGAGSGVDRCAADGGESPGEPDGAADAGLADGSADAGDCWILQ